VERLGPYKFSKSTPYKIPWQQCPRCGRGLNHEQTEFNEVTPPGTEAALKRGDIGPEDATGTFTASLKCGNCSGVIQSAGLWFVGVDFEELEDEDYPQQVFRTFYEPRWLSHYPHLVACPENAPGTIKVALDHADKAFWFDTSVCATALGQVIEVFLDEQGISRDEVGKNGKLRFKGLDARIREFVDRVRKVSEKEAEEYQHLLSATRVVRNDGTHAGEPVGDSEIRFVSSFINRVLERTYTGDVVLDAAKQIIAARTRAKPPASLMPPAPPVPPTAAPTGSSSTEGADALGVSKEPVTAAATLASPAATLKS